MATSTSSLEAPSGRCNDVIDLVDDTEADERKMPARPLPPIDCSTKIDSRINNNNNNSNSNSNKRLGRVDFSLCNERDRSLTEQCAEAPASVESDEDDSVIVISPLVVASMPESVHKKRLRSNSDTDCQTLGDYQLAIRLQQQEQEKVPSSYFYDRVSTEDDYVLAMTLQQQEENDKVSRSQKEQDQMLQTATGKAYAFVEQILRTVNSVTDVATSATSIIPAADSTAITLQPQSCHVDIEAVAKDDMVFMAEKFFLLQEQFQHEYGVDTSADIGFHYTKEANLKKIREHGLLTPSDLQKNRLGDHRNRQAYGEGIYTANNCFSFSIYGPIGILVARLKGNCSPRVRSYSSTFQSDNPHFQTVIGNKRGEQCDPEGLYDEIVLRQSAQVIPLVRFSNSGSIATTTGLSGIDDVNLNRLYDVLEAVYAILDTFCNMGRPTPVTRMSLLEHTEKASPQYSYKVALRGACNSRTSYPAAPFPNDQVVIPAGTSNPLPPMINVPFQPPIPSWIYPSSLSHQPQNSPITSMAATTSLSQATAIPGVTTAPLASLIELVVQYHAPTSLGKTSMMHLQKVLSKDMHNMGQAMHDCAICLCPFVEEDDDGTFSKLNIRIKRDMSLLRLPCGHIFHQECISSSISSLGNRCPFKCSKLIGAPQGKSPSGTMSITKCKALSCSGYENDPTSAGTIVIEYHIPRSRQKSYHPNPGQKHTGAHRTCYLPDTTQGNELLLRLQYAFRHGLTFTIGTSMTTGSDNSVTWASIHHKTNLTGGSKVHGFPDWSYFANCHKELNSLNVPKVEELLHVKVGSYTFWPV